MTTTAADAVGELIRTQTRRIDLTPTIGYTVRAPCLLRQLELAVRVGAERGWGGAAVAGSRPLIAVDAWDLWTDITTAAHVWADHLGVDRRPYRRQEVDALDRRPPAERAPAWMAALAGWLGPVAWDERPEIVSDGAATQTRAAKADQPPPITTAGARRRLAPLSLDDRTPEADIPPVGRLLRAVAAQAIARGEDEITDRIARSATSWADRIRATLAQLDADERVWPIRGANCQECGTSSVVDERPDGAYRLPAIQVRLQPLPDGDDQDQADDNLWPYRVCLACGDNGWLAYTTETPEASDH